MAAVGRPQQGQKGFSMKRLLTGVAVAALMAAGLPALAQSDNSDQMKKPAQSTSRSGASAQNTKQATPSDAAAQSGASTPSSSAKKHARKHQSANARGGRSPEDNMAEELNRQELQRLSGGNQGSNQMPSGQSGTSSQSGATGQGGMSSTGGAQQHQ